MISIWVICKWALFIFGGFVIALAAFCGFAILSEEIKLKKRRKRVDTKERTIGECLDAAESVFPFYVRCTLSGDGGALAGKVYEVRRDSAPGDQYFARYNFTDLESGTSADWYHKLSRFLYLGKTKPAIGVDYAKFGCHAEDVKKLVKRIYNDLAPGKTPPT